MSIWSPKKNTLFDAALKKVKTLSSALQESDFEIIPNKWKSVIQDDPNSPMVMGMGENKHLIYYPPNSTPYLHQYEESIKFVEILSGELTDLITGKTYVTGDRLKIYPRTNIQPYTSNSPAYVRVCVSNVDSIWERVCN